MDKPPAKCTLDRFAQSGHRCKPALLRAIEAVRG